MIFISTNEPDLNRIHGVPGAFHWWYLDLLDRDGNGVVGIWSAGLPLLPGDPLRRLPEQEPSLNLCIYKDWRLEFYLLQRYPATDAGWEFPLRMGANTLHRTEDGLILQIDAPLPGSDGRVRGELRVQGQPLRELQGCRGVAGAHQWGPRLLPAEGRAELQVGDQRMSLYGRAYVDRNHSTVPLDGLGISHWLWGRVALPGRDRLWYLVWPKQEGEKPLFLDMRVGGDGVASVRETQPELGPRRWDRWGMPWWPMLQLPEPALTVTRWEIVDRGPFYLRFLIEAEEDGQRGVGMAEVVAPDRVNLPGLSSLVRMRVHSLHEENSPMVRYFTGLTAGRYERLWAAATGAP